MGRGRTTTGMVTACLISTVMNWTEEENVDTPEEANMVGYDAIDGPSEEEAYLQGVFVLLSLNNMLTVLGKGNTRPSCTSSVYSPTERLRSA
jgi:hypothetical protein